MLLGKIVFYLLLHMSRTLAHQKGNRGTGLLTCYSFVGFQPVPRQGLSQYDGSLQF